ncbi:hypothetical protein BELL_0337g00050 [Botrytis elliptica]|uniref:Uncharacterized protein n=1 Tax=Botrytis elliptica TaxID=278938 RepID=A0A4Z1JJ15_9HELO|nr:hypothetical protein BELL_0337g00050 [Botrytis elliptica]
MVSLNGLGINLSFLPHQAKDPPRDEGSGALHFYASNALVSNTEEEFRCPKELPATTPATVLIASSTIRASSMWVASTPCISILA